MLRRVRMGWCGRVLAVGLAAGLGCAGTPVEPDQEVMNRKRAASHYNIAVDHMESGRVELAMRELLQAARLDPENARVQHAIGMAYLQKGKPAEAEAHIRRALEISPDYQEARYNLSTLYLNQGRYEECIRHSQVLWDDATYQAPWRALTNWGWAAYKLGEVDEARRHLEYARDYHRTYWPTLLNLGILEAEVGNRSEAVRYFSEVLEMDPGPSATAEASYRLAEIYVSLGKREKALSHLRTAIVRAPSDPWGKRSEDYLKRLR